MESVISKKKIKQIIDRAEVPNLIGCMEKAFTEYSSGNAVVPPVGTLTFDSPPGDVHIKYGYIKGDPVYVIKIASGFYENPALGISSSNGLNLVFSQNTGQIKAILMDEGYLTDIRTGLAGAVAAKYMAPAEVDAIGIIGSGIQARMQLRFLKEILDCRRVLVWGRSKESLSAYRKEMSQYGFEIETTLNAAEVARECSLIVTVTPSITPLLYAGDLREDVHITAVGADTTGKQELETDILKQAKLLVADSAEQSREHGEMHKAMQAGELKEKSVIELGEMISSKQQWVRKPGISVADLTGIATQDIQISKFVIERL
ncbi:MAG: hypothetical protein R3222_10250 [Balneolaceae bacterium]|nr:hypothetical protein [Balneolaceae bacterium]